MNKKAIVAGAGIAGIAVAIRLALKGYQVEVFEKNTGPGGKLSEINKAGFRFDAGPSLFTLPELVCELFLIAGKNPEEHFRYRKLEEICRYFYEDGTKIYAHADPEKLSQELELKTGVSGAKVREHLQKSRQMYELTEKLFLQSSLHKASSYLKKHSLKAFVNLPRLNTSRLMHKVNARQFGNSKVTQLFDRYATYNGSDPYKAPATLNIIPHLEYNLGAYFPEKGMYDVTLSLEKLARDTGVKFFYEQPVEEIVTENNKAIGIRTRKKIVHADIIVSDIDIHTLYRTLLRKEKAPEKLLSQEKSTSAIVFYWGIKGQFEETGLHNIFFSENYKEEFFCLSDKKCISSDPTIYLNISSKLKFSDAPQGCENWFVMINVPYNTGQNWDKLIAESREAVLTKLERILKTNVRELIMTESVLDPRLIEEKTGSAMGALYGNSSNSQFSAFLRHPNFSRNIKNLYFCGGSVHPGGGIPLCLFSAKIISDLIPAS